MGKTTGPDCARGWLDLGNGVDGAASPDGRITGCYLHGLFRSDGFRKAWLQQFGAISALSYTHNIEATLDALADYLESHMDLDGFLEIAAPVAAFDQSRP